MWLHFSSTQKLVNQNLSQSFSAKKHLQTTPINPTPAIRKPRKLINILDLCRSKGTKKFQIYSETQKLKKESYPIYKRLLTPSKINCWQKIFFSFVRFCWCFNRLQKQFINSLLQSRRFLYCRSDKQVCISCILVVKGIYYKTCQNIHLSDTQTIV